jgi:RND family efflux transporter MFP subunit
MKKILSLISASALLLTTLSGCDNNAALNKKKKELSEWEDKQKDAADHIAKLQQEIAVLDPSSVAEVKAKLVTIDTVSTQAFDHYIDLQGKIDAQNVAYASPHGQGGVVKAVYVKQGDVVRKGQLLLKLDDAVQSQSAQAAKQQVAGIKAQLDQAKSLYERQQNLWKQNIGTEVQVLNAKTAVDAAQSQYDAALSNAKMAQAQLDYTNVYAEMSGVANIVNVRIGEMFTVGQQIQIVSNNDLKVTVNVPENYLDKVHVGSNLKITFPESDNKTIMSKVSVSGKLIDPVSRSFYVEGKIPAEKNVRPNQIAIVRILDYSTPNAITVPVNTIQNDEKGKYIMVASLENKKLFARKRSVQIGQLYGDKLEVKTGLKPGDLIITDGFQNLYEGQAVTTLGHVINNLN